MRNHASSFLWMASMSAVALAGCSGSPTEESGDQGRPLADVSEAREELFFPDLCADFTADGNTSSGPSTVSATGVCLNHYLKHPGSLPYIYVVVSFPSLASNSAGCAAASVRLRVHRKTSTGWPTLIDTTFHAQLAGGKCFATGDRLLSNPPGELWANIITDPLDLTNDITSQWQLGT
jgi:hypothetical protein